MNPVLTLVNLIDLPFGRFPPNRKSSVKSTLSYLLPSFDLALL
jgi:hypothetical protein